jgi:hypothetical protein
MLVEIIDIIVYVVKIIMFDLSLLIFNLIDNSLKITLYVLDKNTGVSDVTT